MTKFFHRFRNESAPKVKKSTDLKDFFDGLEKYTSEEDMAASYEKYKKELEKLVSSDKFEEKKWELRQKFMTPGALRKFKEIDQEVQKVTDAETLDDLKKRLKKGISGYKKEKEWLEKRLDQQCDLKLENFKTTAKEEKVAQTLAKKTREEKEKEQADIKSSKKAAEMMEKINDDIASELRKYQEFVAKNKGRIAALQKEFTSLKRGDLKIKEIRTEIKTLTKNQPKLQDYFGRLALTYKEQSKDLDDSRRKAVLDMLQAKCNEELVKLKAERKDEEKQRKADITRAKKQVKRTANAIVGGETQTNTAKDLRWLLSNLPQLLLDLKTGGNTTKLLDIHDPAAIVGRILVSSPKLATSIAAKGLFRMGTFRDFVKDPVNSKIGKLLANDPGLTRVLVGNKDMWKMVLEAYQSELNGVIGALLKKSEESERTEASAELSKEFIAKVVGVHAGNLLEFLSGIEGPVRSILEDEGVAPSLKGLVGISGETAASLVGFVANIAPSASKIPPKFITDLVSTLLSYPASDKTVNQVDLEKILKLLPSFQGAIIEFLSGFAEDQDLQGKLLALLKLVGRQQSAKKEEFLPEFMDKCFELLQNNTIGNFVKSQSKLGDGSIFLNAILDQSYSAISAHLSEALFAKMDQLDGVKESLKSLLLCVVEGGDQSEILKHANELASSGFVHGVIDSLQAFLKDPKSKDFKGALSELIENQVKDKDVVTTLLSFIKKESAVASVEKDKSGAKPPAELTKGDKGAIVSIVGAYAGNLLQIFPEIKEQISIVVTMLSTPEILGSLGLKGSPDAAASAIANLASDIALHATTIPPEFITGLVSVLLRPTQDSSEIVDVAATHAAGLLKFTHEIKDSLKKALEDSAISERLKELTEISGQDAGALVDFVTNIAPSASDIPPKFITDLVDTILTYPTPTSIDLQEILKLLPSFQDPLKKFLPDFAADQALQGSLVDLLRLVSMPQSEFGKDALLNEMGRADYIPNLIEACFKLLQNKTIGDFVKSQAKFGDGSIFHNPILGKSYSEIAAHLARTFFENTEHFGAVKEDLKSLSKLVTATDAVERPQIVKYIRNIAESEFLERMINGLQDFLKDSRSKDFKDALNELIRKQPKLARWGITGDTIIGIISSSDFLRNVTQLLIAYEDGKYLDMLANACKLIGTVLSDLNVMVALTDIYKAALVNFMVPIFIKRLFIEDDMSAKIGAVVKTEGSSLDFFDELAKGSEKTSLLLRHFIKSRNFSELRLDVDLSGFKMSSFDFQNTKFTKDASLKNVEISNCDFTGAELSGENIDLSGAQIDMKSLKTMTKMLGGKNITTSVDRPVKVMITKGEDLGCNITKVKELLGENVQIIEQEQNVIPGKGLMDFVRSKITDVAHEAKGASEGAKAGPSVIGEGLKIAHAGPQETHSKL